MNRQIRLQQASIGKRFMDRYMAEPFDFGGETMTRAQVYDWFEKNNLPGRAADYWLMGAENVQKLKAANQKP